MALQAMEKIAPLPKHIAFIMDGNGRWAEQRGLRRIEGHRAGVKNLRSTVKHLDECHVKYVTVYGFSTENWSRPKREVTSLLHLLQDAVEQECLELHKNNVRLNHLGRLEGLPPGLKQAINGAIELTENNTGMVLSFAFNYGGRLEILDAVQRIISEGIPAENINEALFDNYIYTAGLPDVDLLIRTGGEIRLSNFLIWQTVYSEYYFTPVLWPSFNEEELDKALLAYSQRRRRFGGL